MWTWKEKENSKGHDGQAEHQQEEKTRKKKVPTKKINVVFQPAITHARNKSRTAILEASSSQFKGKDDTQQDQNDNNADNISADQIKVVDGAE